MPLIQRLARRFAAFSFVVLGMLPAKTAAADVVIDSLPDAPHHHAKPSTSTTPTEAPPHATSSAEPAPFPLPPVVDEPKASASAEPRDSERHDDVSSKHPAPPVDDVEASSSSDLPDVVDKAFEAELDQAAEKKDPKVFAEVLHRLIGKVREKVVPKLEDKIEKKGEQTMSRVSMTLGIFSFAGVFLLFLPLLYNKKYPGKGILLFKYSTLAAVTFFVSVNLFAGVLTVLKTAQHSVATVANPQIAVTLAALDSLDDNAEEMVDYGETIVEPTLRQLQSGDTEEPLPAALIENVGKVAKSAGDVAPTFQRVAGLLKDLDWITGYLPAALTILTVLLFLLAARPILKEIVALPARAASGEENAGRAVLKNVFSRIGRELIVTLCLIGVLLVVTLLGGIALSLAVRPAVEALLGYVLDSAIYVQSPDASGTTLLVSFGASILFVALNIGIVMTASAFFIQKTHKLLQQRFHEGVPLKAHQRFFVWGPLALCLAFALPTLFAEIAEPLVDGPITGFFLKGNNVHWTGLFLSGPLVFVFGFLLVFWAARGLKALLFIRGYPLEVAGTTRSSIPPSARDSLHTIEGPQFAVAAATRSEWPHAESRVIPPAPDTPWHAKGGAHPITTFDAPDPSTVPTPEVASSEAPEPTTVPAPVVESADAANAEPELVVIPLAINPSAEPIASEAAVAKDNEPEPPLTLTTETPAVAPSAKLSEKEIVAAAIDFDDNAPTALVSKNWWQGPPSKPGDPKP